MNEQSSQGPFPSEHQQEAEEASAQELAPPNQTPGEGPGDPNPEIFPATQGADVDVSISHDPYAPEGTQDTPEVEKLSEKHWTHDETDEVFDTKHEAVADADAAVAPDVEDPDGLPAA